MSKVQEYKGFVLSPSTDTKGIMVAIAHQDGRIFSMGTALSRCFYTPPFPSEVDAMKQAKALLDAEIASLTANN